MDVNQTVNQAKETLEGVKKDPKNVFKLHWLFPLAAAIALWLSQSFLLQNVKNFWMWLIIVAVAFLGGLTLYKKSQNKPNPLGLGWAYFLIPVASVVAILLLPEFFSWVIGILIAWAAIAAIVKYKAWEYVTKYFTGEKGK